MSGHRKHIEKIVRELREDGVTYFYKRRGEVTGCIDHVVPYSDTTPKLRWDEFTGENYSPEFVWLLYYFDGKEDFKVYIPPDNIPPEDVEEWYYTVRSWRNPEDTSEVDHKAFIENAIKSHTDTYSFKMGESPQLCLASARLSSLRDEIDEMESSLHEQLWKIVYTAYKAGREAEYSSSADGREIAKKGKAMVDQQSPTSRCSSSPWILHVVSLLESNFSISAEHIAQSLRDEGFCDYSDWGQDIHFLDGETNSKTLPAFRNSVSGIKSRLREKSL